MEWEIVIMAVGSFPKPHFPLLPKKKKKKLKNSKTPHTL